MDQFKAPQLRLDLSEQLTLRPDEREKLVSLVAALLLDIAEREAEREQR